MDFSKYLLFKGCIFKGCSGSHCSLLELEMTMIMNEIARGYIIPSEEVFGPCFLLGFLCRTVYLLKFLKDLSKAF